MSIAAELIQVRSLIGTPDWRQSRPDWMPASHQRLDHAMLAGLILAAGQARRFGKTSVLLLPNGQGMLAHVLSQYRPVCPMLWVVTHPRCAGH